MIDPFESVSDQLDKEEYSINENIKNDITDAEKTNLDSKVENNPQKAKISRAKKRERKWACNYCGSSFLSNGNLQVHINGVHLKIF